MKRIGIAASKMSKGNIMLYNVYVVLISSLFSAFIFIVTGATVLLALAVITYVGSEIMGAEFEKKWASIFTVCMIALTVVISVLNLCAISMNIKFLKTHKD